MELLPHRYPMLLVDRILEYEMLKRAVGYKNVSMNEAFLQGHFPGQPLMPGVYMIEALAQLGGTILLRPFEFRRRTALLTGIDKAKFRRRVVPGDRFDMEVVIGRVRSSMGWISAVGSVDGKIACTAELMFSIATVADSSATVLRD